MIRLTSTAALALCSVLTSVSPLLAATPAASSAGGAASAAAQPAEKCLGDVKALNDKMSKDGYWLGGSGYGYGYPMGGYGYGYGYGGYGVPLGSMPPGNAAGYGSARPGYEIRTLMASATVLAQMGQEQQCQTTVLATTQTIYTRHAADLHARGIHSADMPGWHQRQITAAVPMIGGDVTFRPDQLLDADVVSRGNETLGSVHDLVLNPHTGKIAYLIIGRGGLLGSTPCIFLCREVHSRSRPMQAYSCLTPRRRRCAQRRRSTTTRFLSAGNSTRRARRWSAPGLRGSRS